MGPCKMVKVTRVSILAADVPQQPRREPAYPGIPITRIEIALVAGHGEALELMAASPVPMVCP